MTYDVASRLADRIASELAPMCDKIAVAGSIRRQCSQVNDIDLVILPLPGMQPAIRKRCLASHPAIREDGDQNLKITLKNQVKLDIYWVPSVEPDMFIRQPSPWGSRLLCRTGSARFNRWFASQAQEKHMHWNPYFGLYRGPDCIACATERDLFDALGIAYIPPQDRDK